MEIHGEHEGETKSMGKVDPIHLHFLAVALGKSRILRKLFRMHSNHEHGVLNHLGTSNTRASRKFVGYFVKTEATPVWRKAIVSTFKQAWRENAFLVGKTSLLKDIRCDRTRFWHIAI